ncbi:hypothetical protein EXIGLDRAFT_292741 [Exidia glandulosa HHB12029]|uniref:F-box domain-containing protein n=1 Tax=Exidia glandulosa HHB12029 TaxID=1314781 RepID=A0A165M1H5_EXIGL|nr:hypothetical protein EXIGLDRAFT_292741 [Exidia glandulosa HHB12029]
MDVAHIAAEVREVAALAIAAELFDINQSESRLCSLPDEVISLVAAHMSFNNLLTACQICSRWRTAILSDARLWIHITLRLNDDQLRDSAWMSHSLDELLARSMRLPVSISITDRDNREGAEKHDAPLAVPAIVIKHLHRSRSLSLSFLNHGLDVGQLTQPAPLLEILTLMRCGSDSISNVYPTACFL